MIAGEDGRIARADQASGRRGPRNTKHAIVRHSGADQSGVARGAAMARCATPFSSRIETVTSPAGQSISIMPKLLAPNIAPIWFGPVSSGSSNDRFNELDVASISRGTRASASR
jgi:hypothetical protein